MKNAEDIYPLTPMQQGMMFLTLQEPEAGRYVEQYAFRIEGALDVDAFERAWQRVVMRHGIFRTAFLWEGLEQPVQVVRRHVPLPFEAVDWRGRDVDAALAEHRAAQRKRGFSLLKPPLMHLLLARTGSDEHLFVWSYHHLLLDGWSVSVLREVFAFYRAFWRGESLVLPDPTPYARYIAWLKTQDDAEAEAYWRDVLAGVTAPTPLPADRRPTSATPSGASHQRSAGLDADAGAALESLARTHRVTPNTVVQGAWAMLLARYAASDDVVCGTVASGRPGDLPGADSIVGLFINSLPMRARVDATARVGAWLADLQAQQAEARQFEHCPLYRVQRWSDVPAGTPLFESLLVFQNFSAEDDLPDALDVAVTPVELDEAAKYPLLVTATPGATLKLQIVADAQQFSAAMTEEILDRLVSLLTRIAAHPDARVGALVATTPDEREPVVHAFNDTAVPFERSTPEPLLHAPIADQARRRPDAVAVRFDGRHWTYAALEARANRLAHHLRASGAERGRPVGVCLTRSDDLVVTLLAVVTAGAAYLPLDPEAPADRIATLTRSARPPVVVTHAATRDVASRAAGHLAETARPAHVDLDADRAAIDRQTADAPPVDLAGRDLAYVIYTSGSTGAPKGVEIEHRSIDNRLRWMQDAYALGSDDVVVQKTPFSFDVSVWEFFWTLREGACLAVLPPGAHRRPDAVADALTREQATTLHFVPSMLRAFVPAATPASVRALRRVICSGEALPVDLVDAMLARAPHVQLDNLYGPTEATVDVTRWTCTPNDAHRTVPIGAPIANVATYVLDADAHPVPVGVPGELHLGGVQVARGYLSDPRRTAAAFVPDPFAEAPGARLYRTGDRVRWGPGGALEFLGRVDRQVKLRGHRIEPGEIEAVLCRHDAIADAAVVLHGDAADAQLVAYVVADAAAVSVQDVRRHVASQLPGVMVPAVVAWLDALPLTRSGKLDRKRLPDVAPTRDALAPDAVYAAPTGDVERTVARVWRDVLGLERIGVHDNFFDLGGHSLRVVTAFGKLKDVYGDRIELMDFFRHPTVHALAAHLQDGAAATHGDGASAEAALPEAAPPEAAPADVIPAEAAPAVAPPVASPTGNAAATDAEATDAAATDAAATDAAATDAAATDAAATNDDALQGRRRLAAQRNRRRA